MPFTGLAKPPVRDRSNLSFDPIEYIDYGLTWDDLDRDMPGG